MSDSTPNQDLSHQVPNENEYIVSDQWDGTTRRLYRKVCPCGNHFWIPRHKYNKLFYCSTSCSARDHRNQEQLTCKYCHKQFERRAGNQQAKTGHYFCSRACKDAAQGIDGIQNFSVPLAKDGVRAYRTRAIKYYGAKCSICGYCEHPKMLDVDHIDSDRSNNKLDNLQVLCVWCHALKTRGVPYHERKQTQE
jgi:hypothetical protein